MKNNVYVVSCDWYAIQCESEWAVDEVLKFKKGCADDMPPSISAPVPHFEEMSDVKREVRDIVGLEFTYGAETFKATRSTEFSPLYNSSCLITWRGRPLLHCFYSPRRADMSRLSCQAKVANAALYSSNWPSLLRCCLRAIGWRFVRVVRVDIAADFEYFANGRLPLKFAQDYLNDRPSRVRPTFIRKSSNKWTAHGVKAFDRSLIETISWGTRESAVQVNLYNKTAELLHKADKTYIREKWRAYGLPADLDAPVKRFVWRVEFSINPSRKFVHDKIHGQVREILQSDFETQAALNDFFRALLPDYFQFYYVTPEDKKKGRRVKDLWPVTLFADCDCAPWKLRTYVHSTVSGRTEKILMKRLADVIDSNECNADEKMGLRAAYKKLSEIYHEKDAQGHGVVTSDDLLCGFLQQLSPVKAPHIWLSPRQKHRELQRYVAMLIAAHDDNFNRFSSQFEGARGILDYLSEQLQGIADGLPAWFFDAQDEFRREAEDDGYWESLIKDMPTS